MHTSGVCGNEEAPREAWQLGGFFMFHPCEALGRRDFELELDPSRAFATQKISLPKRSN
jgi:hypothetical protein